MADGKVGAVERGGEPDALALMAKLAKHRHDSKATIEKLKGYLRHNRATIKSLRHDAKALVERARNAENRVEKLADALKALAEWSSDDLGHDADCPEDGTCECRLPGLINEALAGLR